MHEVIHRLRRDGFLTTPFRLVDVGCSGGYYKALDRFHPQLEVDAFDPLVREVERLKKSAPAFVRYHDAFVVSDDLAAPTGPSNSFQARTSAVAYKKEKKISPIKDRFNSGEEVVYSTNKVVLDEFFSGQEIDFIKVDTDGHDFEVLHGARKMLEAKQVIGVAVEVRFTGRQCDHANLWRNIDRILCMSGLSLFDLQLRRYSRAALPSPFIRGPGPTERGQANWGDALYLRDIGAPAYEANWGVQLSAEKIAKTIGVCATLGFPDCALEILQKYQDRFGASFAALNKSLSPRNGVGQE